MITGKKQGGLGIKNLKNQSKALKLKWLWRYAHEPYSLWSKVIKLKYGEMDSWVTKEATNPYGVTVWRSIRNWWPFLRNHTTITVHNGVRTQFWKDRWLGNQNLSEIFPDIFDLALHKDRTVAEMWSPQGWDLSLRRNLNDWEVCRLVEFFKRLESFQGLKEGEDCLWWTEPNKGRYKVSSGYKVMNRAPLTLNWPWRQIWKTKIPLKVACFTWLLSKEAVLTHENLRKRNNILVTHCCLCGEAA
uniref:Reverse transcriptase zinc-binding domain-containing protein n=1 Tax=Solanum tuberosum TaxID=4113 RepID=M1BMF1_SOLTU